MEYIFKGKLDNTVHDISYDQLKLLYRDNVKEAKESHNITKSSYSGENYYDRYQNFDFAFQQEYLKRDPRTSGMRMYYPHGVVIEQAARRNYYRGENQVYTESLPSLLRSLKQFDSIQEKELYRMVADMRIAEFSCFLNQFQHVKEWKNSDILYEILAQHYGLETGWLDITSDFDVALFFATCFWDNGQWKPLTREQTEVDEKHQYGMIFHMPSNRMPMRWLCAIPKFMPYSDEVVGKSKDGNSIYKSLDVPIYRGDVGNLIYPIGFQPFMRCHMQHGYGIYMRTPNPLQQDFEFEKLRFRHSEELSKRVFDLMRGGEFIYPHEGLKSADFIIDKIKSATTFSEEAFQYALYRSHYYKLENADQAKEDLSNFKVDGKNIVVEDRHPWKLSSGRRKYIDALYNNFSVENWYGIRIMDRLTIPPPNKMFEPWMIPEECDGEGIQDFKLREKVDCGMSIVERDWMNIISTLVMAKLPDF